VRLPLGGADFDAACAQVPLPLRLAQLLPGASATVILGSGGPTFFEHFERSPEAGDGAPHPLDRFTARVVAVLAAGTLPALGIAHALYYPFVGHGPLIPFQRLGRAAGLGAPGPLGLQIHPEFGPWWAYRALLVVASRDALALAGDAPADGCAGCSAPCVTACPAGAVSRDGFAIPACHARRLAAEPCRLSCDARIACIRGPAYRYSERQLAFHMRASLPRPSPA
jgi:ferredoxin